MNNKQIVIVDYGLGNLFSVKHACDYFNIKTKISDDKNDIKNADGVILPGVGAFGEAMENLRKLDLVLPIIDYVQKGKPFLGVCLGMQLLFSESEEFGNNKGLGIINGQVKRFPTSSDSSKRLRVPQIGWNQIHKNVQSANHWEGTPLSEISDGEYMYFVHSFFCEPQSEDNVLAKTKYDYFEYCSAVVKENVCAMQFHPEKSGPKGIKIYQNWLKSI